MDLLNGTGEQLSQHYDGVQYDFPPGDVVKIDQDAGRFIVSKLRKSGLREVHFGEDPRRVAYEAMKDCIGGHHQAISDYEKVVEFAERHKGTVPATPPSVVNARRALKAYESVWGEMKAEFEEKDEADAIEKIKEAQSKSSSADMPELEDMEVGELRAKAEGMGIDLPDRVNGKTLRAWIRKAVKAEEG